ncbi:MAG: protein kinase domain-containing protein [Polyangiales bacterium]
MDTVLSGKWRLERILGVGRTGAVYVASDFTGWKTAIKIFDTEGRIPREAYAANRVDHPAVVHVLDDGMHGGRPYLVTELIEGGCIEARVTESQLLDLAEQVLDALVTAHACDVFHRGLGPHSLLLDRAGRVHIVDFGFGDEPATSSADLRALALTLTSLSQFVARDVSTLLAEPWSSAIAMRREVQRLRRRFSRNATRAYEDDVHLPFELRRARDH